MDERLYIDIVALLENVVPEIDPEFNFRVVTFDELEEAHGLTIPSQKIIKIREDIYDGACQGNGRDRMTLTHEFAHYLLHDEAIGLARVMEGEKLKPYHDPEWQATAFAGEFLIPAHLISNLSIDEIVIKCGVSYEAARYQKERQ